MEYSDKILKKKRKLNQKEYRIELKMQWHDINGLRYMHYRFKNS